MKNKYVIVGIVAAVLAGLAWYHFIYSARGKDKFGDMKPQYIPGAEFEKELKSEAQKKQPTMYCPQAKDLIKKGDKWWSRDGKWTHYTPSAATKIISFQGAQWAGVKVGTIICLYKTNEAAPFPVALEYTKSRNVIDPKGGGWSAKVGGNRKICKSVNVVDCPYVLKAAKSIGNIYEEIKYAPIEEF